MEIHAAWGARTSSQEICEKAFSSREARDVAQVPESTAMGEHLAVGATADALAQKMPRAAPLALRLENARRR